MTMRGSSSRKDGRGAGLGAVSILAACFIGTPAVTGYGAAIAVVLFCIMMVFIVRMLGQERNA